jgi:prepilin-type processing-associated H-X9-DG protein
MHNYHDQNNVFITAETWTGNSRSPGDLPRKGYGWRITELPFIEQAPLWNALNQSLTIFNPENTTVYDVQITAYMCPSDPAVLNRVSLGAGQNSPLYDGVVYMHYCSYAGNAGPWFNEISPPDFNTGLAAVNQSSSNSLGVMFQGSRIGVRDITDGTSNTILIGEWPYGKMSSGDQQQWHWWCGYNPGDAIFSTAYIINPKGNCNFAVGINTSYVEDGCAGSFHPGGANFAMCDGSVRFLKDTINMSPWNQQTCTITNIVNNPVSAGGQSVPQWSFTPLTSIGVYQALSTRANGEVISADSY